MLAPQLAQGQHGQCMLALELVLEPPGTDLPPRPSANADALLSCHVPAQQAADTAADHRACAQHPPVRFPTLCGINRTPAAHIACHLLQGAALLGTVMQPPAQSDWCVEQLLQGAMPLRANPEPPSALPDT